MSNRVPKSHCSTESCNPILQNSKKKKKSVELFLDNSTQGVLGFTKQGSSPLCVNENSVKHQQQKLIDAKITCFGRGGGGVGGGGT